MTPPFAFIVDRSKTNKWQKAQMLAAVQVFALVVEPRAVISKIYHEDDSGNDQIGWTMVMPDLAGAKLIEYFEQLTASTGS